MVPEKKSITLVQDQPLQWENPFKDIPLSTPVRGISRPKEDLVNGPSHYNGRECLDWIKQALSAEEYVGALKFNIFKYNWRYKKKNGLEDLKKAQFYQNELVNFLNDSHST